MFPVTVASPASASSPPRYAEITRDELSRVDPANKTAYEQNAAAFLKRVEALDQAIKEAVQTIPQTNRRLLTYHDSWPYFARRYGFQVIGAVQPSDFSDPSPREGYDRYTAAQALSNLVHPPAAAQFPAVLAGR